MNIQEQINAYIAIQADLKLSDMHELQHIILEVMPKCKLWFIDDKNNKGKTVSNPNFYKWNFT